MEANKTVIDEQTVRLAASGDRDAFRKIYSIFGNRVYQTAQRIVGRTDADDVLQEAFIRLFQKLPSFRFESAFSTWLHRLVVNEALQHLRRQGQKKMTPGYVETDKFETSSESSAVSDAAELVPQAMKRIDPELRRIFELKVIDELTYSEISEIVGIPEGTVGSRLNRARRELRVQLVSLGWEV